MSTTARIYFVDDIGNPDEPLDVRNCAARHRAHNACLFIGIDGHPRNVSETGVLDRLEKLIEIAPDRALRSSGELAAAMIVSQYKRPEEVVDVWPTNPTVGAITSYVYLVVCHSRTAEKPSLFLQKGCLWQTEKDFCAEWLSPREWGQLLAWEQDGEPEHSMLLDGVGLVATDARKLLKEARSVRDHG